MTKPKLSPPNAAQVDELPQLHTAAEPELGHFLHIAASTGARRGEMCALRWSNLDPKRMTSPSSARLPKCRAGSERRALRPTQNVVSRSTPTRSRYSSTESIVTNRAKLVGMKIVANAYVFSREPDCLIPMTPGTITKQFQAVRDALGFDNMRLHDLRHFAATRMMTAGIPVRTVAGRLGHANPSTTLSVYTHFVEASDQDAAAVMGNIRTERESPP